MRVRSGSVRVCVFAKECARCMCVMVHVYEYVCARILVCVCVCERMHRLFVLVGARIHLRVRGDVGSICVPGSAHARFSCVRVICVYTVYSYRVFLYMLSNTPPPLLRMATSFNSLFSYLFSGVSAHFNLALFYIRTALRKMLRAGEDLLDLTHCNTLQRTATHRHTVP